MPNITVYMKSGEVKKFEDKGRAGGSWCNGIKYAGAFAIIVDCYGEETIIPAEDIKEIVKDGPRRSF